MILLDGKTLSEKMLAGLAEEIREYDLAPMLGVILVGDDPASHLYVSLKTRAAEQIGIDVETKLFAPETSPAEIVKTIDTLNREEHIHGILVQLPLPSHFDTDVIIGSISPEKDVDGFHPENERRFLAGEPAFFPVFPRAILELAKSSGVSLQGKHAVVIGNSSRFGEMMRAVLEREGARETIFVSREGISSEENLAKIRNADLIVSACGKVDLIRGDMVKEGAIIIDGGIAKTDEGKIVGDGDRKSFEGVNGFLSPVPGGVGPMTIACLLANVVGSAREKEANL